MDNDNKIKMQEQKNNEDIQYIQKIREKIENNKSITDDEIRKLNEIVEKQFDEMNEILDEIEKDESISEND